MFNKPNQIRDSRVTRGRYALWRVREGVGGVAMLPGIFLVREKRRSEAQSHGRLLDLIGTHLVSLNRFEDAFGPAQPHKDPRHASKPEKMQRTVSLSTPSTMQELRALLGAVPSWVKIAGKNGFKLDTDRGKEVVEASADKIDALILHLDTHFPNAGFVFDGDTNEESAPFSQVIKELIVRGRVVACFGTQESAQVTLGNETGPRYELWGDLVSNNFVKSWTEDMPRAPKTCAPCYERPNFVYSLLDFMFTKETVTRNAVAGTVFVGSGLPDYQLRPGKEELTTGYAELVHLLKEPSKDNQSYVNFAHELVPEEPGLIVVVHHGVVGTGTVSPSATLRGPPHPRPRMPEDDAVEQHRKEVVARVKAEAEQAAQAIPNSI